MIATEAEKNPSCFRPDAEGGPHEWRSQWKTVVIEYMRLALQVENRWGNTKYLLGQMIPGKDKAYAAMNKSKCYTDVIKALGLEKVDDLLQQAVTVDEHLGIPQNESRASKRARVKEATQPEEGAKKQKEKRKEKDDEQPEAKRVKVPEVETEAAVAPQEMMAPAALSV
jgi:tRNA-dihydrouridine synthase 2